MLTQLMAHLGDAVLAAPSEPPTAPAGSGIVNTDGIVSTLATVIAPIIVAVVGVGILMRASRGQVSQSLTSTFIVVLGLGMLAASGVLFFVGDKIINLIFS